jgi:hypothetical protein
MVLLLPIIVGLALPGASEISEESDTLQLFTELSSRESGIRFRNMLDESEDLNYLMNHNTEVILEMDFEKARIL